MFKKFVDAVVKCIAESGLLSDVAYVMCLDSVGSGSELFVHVSKPPKNESAVDFLIKVCYDIINVQLMYVIRWALYKLGVEDTSYLRIY